MKAITQDKARLIKWKAKQEVLNGIIKREHDTDKCLELLNELNTIEQKILCIETQIEAYTNGKVKRKIKTAAKTSKPTIFIR